MEIAVAAVIGMIWIIEPAQRVTAKISQIRAEAERFAQSVALARVRSSVLIHLVVVDLPDHEGCTILPVATRWGF
jgi:alkanesulfonate monooxygenase SsuD/methylene tetrahydromethanopterin reductase-like flavin-dependent oxidoreductase (luciferase family)